MIATRRRILVAVAVAVAVVASLFAWANGPTGSSGSAPGREPVISAARGRDVVTPEASPHPPAMPPLTDRIAAMVDERGIPDEARGPLSALGADLRALRARETGAVGNGDTELRAKIAAERRAVSEKSRGVLEALPPSYRAAMRHHRVSVRQLAEWSAGAPQP